MLYYGHPRWEGVASWQGWNLLFTDGICQRCRGRFREEHQATLERRTDPTVSASALSPEEAA